ncbi:MAG: xanthine dehydrogenase family protein molybdopterin-binding subunit, partial [Rhodospirillaceae bacterium]
HDDRYVVRVTAQSAHRIRWVLANQIFRLPETRFRVICDNVGGGFGMKGGTYPEYALAPLAAKIVGRPVKWIAERSEGILSDEQARDNVTEAELALDKDGKFLGLRAQTLANCGAYHNSDRNSGPAIANIGVLAGTYTTPAMFVEVRGVLTNTMLTAHYRGAGRPEAAYVIETLVDLAARKLGIDAAELRRRNTIPASAMPYKTALVYTYDSGDFGKNLEDCLAGADYAGFAARRADSAARGKLRGIGISNTVEATASGMLESAELRFDPSGGITLMMGTHDHGQGHATTFKQILADKLGLDAGLIRYVNGDTDRVTIGTGTFGSRSAVCGGGAVELAARKVVEKGTRIAAHLLEAADSDIVFADGKFTVAGTDRSVGLVDVAKTSFMGGRLPKGVEPGLDEIGNYEGPMTFPNGCHVCEVEVDRATGAVEVVRYTVVDDVGVIINPLLVKGQIHGGIAQGVGQALMEDIAIDDSGQVVTGSFMDYCMPRADDFCAIDVHGNVVPTNTNPLGVKGCGEAGCVGALAAVMNAVNDALAHAGAPYVQMPATPEKVWRALDAARR